MSNTTWTEERHSTDKGYRSAHAYVGRTPKKFWTVWLKTETGYRRTNEVFTEPGPAKAWAESQKGN